MRKTGLPRTKILGRFRGVLAVSVLTATSGLIPSLHAAKACTDHDFTGVFGFYGTGYVVKSPVTILTGPFARLGRFESDGNGHLTFSSTASFNGHLIPQDFTGTYTTNPDCTLTTTVYLPDPINLPVNFISIISDDGNENRDLFVNPPGVVVTGAARKQHMGQCSKQDLSGAYALEMSGAILQEGSAGRIPFSALARIDADGTGNIVGKLGSNYGGLPVPQEDISGTYTVDPNCIFHLTYYTAGEGHGPNDGVTLKGVFIDAGTGAFLMVLQPSTATVLGSLKLQTTLRSNPGRLVRPTR